MNLRHYLLIFPMVAAAIFAGGCSAEARKARYLAKADKYFSEGRMFLAEVEYLNVFKIDDKDARAITGLGLVYYEEGRFGRVGAFLRDALQLQPANLEVRTKLAATMYAFGDRAAARAEAIAILELDPLNPMAPLLLADTAVEAKEIEEDRRRLENLPRDASARAPVLVALGNLARRQNDLTGAQVLYRRAVGADPSSGEAQIALALLAWQTNEIGQAEEIFKKALPLLPARSPHRLEYARFKIATGHLDEAKAFLADMARDTPDYITLVLTRAEIAFTEKKYAEVRRFLDVALTKDSLHPDALLLDARLRLSLHAIREATSTLEAAANIYPRSPQIYYHLGMAYADAGRNVEAIASLTRSLALAPSYIDPLLLLAQINIRTGNYNAAISSLAKYVRDQTNVGPALLMLGKAHRAQGNLENALKVYELLGKLTPKSPEPAFLAGQVHLDQDKPAEAEADFLKSVEVSPGYLPAVEQLVNLNIQAGRFTQIRELVTRQIATSGLPVAAQAQLQLLLGKIGLAERNVDLAETALRKAIELQPDAPTPYFLLGRMYVATKRQQPALESLGKVVAKDPKNITALMLIGVLHEEAREYQDASRAFEKVLVISPKFGPALNDLAWLYSEFLGKLDRAFELAKQAREIAPAEPNTADTLGWIQVKRRQFSTGRTLLQEAAAGLPNVAEIQFHLGLAEYNLGYVVPAQTALKRALTLNKELPQRGEAEQLLQILDTVRQPNLASAQTTLEKWTATRKDDSFALSRLAAIYAEQGQADRAFSTYNRALTANPENPTPPLRLAEIYVSRQDATKAMGMAKLARKLAPYDPSVADQAARVALRARESTWAATILQEAVGTRPDDPDLAYDYAEALYATGHIAEAEERAQGVLKNNAPFSRSEQARRFLGLIKPETSASAASIEAVLKSDPSYLPALAAEAALLDRKADPRRSVQAYEKILANYPDFTPAKRRLAILYSELQGSDQKAFELGFQARTMYPNDSDLAKALGIVLYRRGEFVRAVTMLMPVAEDRATDPEVIYHLGMAQAKSRNRAASETLGRALKLDLPAQWAAEAKKTLSGLPPPTKP